jgi:hypothetical protein
VSEKPSSQDRGVGHHRVRVDAALLISIFAILIALGSLYSRRERTGERRGQSGRAVAPRSSSASKAASE